MSELDLLSAIGGAIAAALAAAMLTGIAWLLKLLYRTLRNLDRALQSQGELKGELIAIGLHLQELNSTVATTRRDVDVLQGAVGVLVDRKAQVRAPEQD